MIRNAKLKLGLASLLAALISAPLAFAQGERADEAMGGMMQEEGMMQGEGMMDEDMSEMMGMMQMMQMMQQMAPMMEACTEMMQAMANPMEPTEAPDALDDQG